MNSQQTYVIGDVQGCYNQAQKLCDAISEISPSAEILFLGDIVNRGPESLATLRLLRSLGDRCDTVLGNHDLHLLAVANGVRNPGRSDTINEILEAPDGEDLLDWLRHRPMMLAREGHLLVHGGLLPQWTPAMAMTLAGEVESALRGPRYLSFFGEMYGNTPSRWNDDLQGAERLRCIVNAMTRMRYCQPDGTMELGKAEPAVLERQGALPWFDVPGRRSQDVTVVFGHWSQLGLVLRPRLVGLDTGCVWGGKLTAVNLQDRSIIQVDCPQYQKPQSH